MLSGPGDFLGFSEPNIRFKVETSKSKFVKVVLVHIAKKGRSVGHPRRLIGIGGSGCLRWWLGPWMWFHYWRWCRFLCWLFVVIWCNERSPGSFCHGRCRVRTILFFVLLLIRLGLGVLSAQLLIPLIYFCFWPLGVFVFRCSSMGCWACGLK